MKNTNMESDSRTRNPTQLCTPQRPIFASFPFLSGLWEKAFLPPVQTEHRASKPIFVRSKSSEPFPSNPSSRDFQCPQGLPLGKRPYLLRRNPSQSVQTGGCTIAPISIFPLPSTWYHPSDLYEPSGLKGNNSSNKQSIGTAHRRLVKETVQNPPQGAQRSRPQAMIATRRQLRFQPKEHPIERLPPEDGCS